MVDLLPKLTGEHLVPIWEGWLRNTMQFYHIVDEIIHDVCDCVICSEAADVDKFCGTVNFDHENGDLPLTFVR